MEKYTLKYGLKHKAGILLGILAAVTILFSQSFYYSLSESDTFIQDEQKSSETKKADDKHEVITSSNVLLSSIAQLNIEKIASFVIEIPFNDGVNFGNLRPEPGDYNTYFRTLFRQIISPNAP